MKSFESYKKQLNPQQRQAVDTIEGPVLVIAGPGTGKTQLLSLRAANIVRQTDTQPGGILCLTFTESAAANMRERLVRLMGAEGNKVAVHTFHSFGSEVINQHPEHFYNGARFSPADELASFEVLHDIFDALPHSSPLAKTMNGEFTYLPGAQDAISYLKRAGLLPDELRAILAHNEMFCEALEPHITNAFAARLTKKDLPQLETLAQTMQNFTPSPVQPGTIKPLASLCTAEFMNALNQSQNSGKTTALTAWRNRWCEKDNADNLVLKDRARIKKLRALAHVYQKYREYLAEKALFDFDDMVSLVAHTIESSPTLRFDLQEQYLYIMVDEFQDTNGAQLRLLAALADNPVNEGRPNVLAVGDDDQAIYAFQGAEISSMLDFTARYRNTTIITLADNYRSAQPILHAARRVITQGQQRLETVLEHINKQLTPHVPGEGRVEMHQFADSHTEYEWVATEAHRLIASGTPPTEIAVIARTHKQLLEALPHLHAAGLSVQYERRNNVLEDPHIKELITLAKVVTYLNDQRFDLAEELLPQLLSCAFWGLKTTDLWRLSIRAWQERRMWLELMLDTPGRLHQIAEFLIIASHQALHEPLDVMLDMLIGTQEKQITDDSAAEPLPPTGAAPNEDFVSPFRDFYFNEQRLKHNPTDYLAMLNGLQALRASLRGYRPGVPLELDDLINFAALCERTGTTIIAKQQQTEAAQGINLLTAHKAKGLEFEAVFVLGCEDARWGRKARHPSSSMSFPYNMPIQPAGASYDDALRLFFVAMTRTKRQLLLTYSAVGPNGKSALVAEFLLGDPKPQVHEHATPPLEQLTPGWHHRHLALPKQKQSDLLGPILGAYRLSATHINNFVDVTRGGPQAFLLQNLLRFPQAEAPAQVLGRAVHAVLQRAHVHLTATGERRPLEDILHDFELQLQQGRLTERDFSYQLEKGSQLLSAYLTERYPTFTPEQRTERNFINQNVMLGDVRLTGVIDVMEVNKAAKTITITDYKTGKPHSNWRGATDYEKIKLHKYKQQLMLYKLLVEHSRDFSDFTVTSGVLDFVETDPSGRLHQLHTNFDTDELARFIKLITAIWQRICSLSLPDTSDYPQSYQGVLDFERSLIG